MERQDQVELIQDLTRFLGSSIIANVESGKIPPEWDAIELRQLVADRAKAYLFKMERQRKIAYNNTVLCNNL